MDNSNPKQALEAAKQATVDRYAVLGRMVRGYVKGKLKWDPVYAQLAERLPFANPVLDLGCGRGQLLALLMAMQPGIKGIGLDWDREKVAGARFVNQDHSGLCFHEHDLRNPRLPKARTILLIDVLHYMPTDEQDRLLAAVVDALLDGGRVFIRDVDNSGGRRSLINRWQERIGSALGIHLGAGLHFRPLSVLTEKVGALGLTTTVVPSWGKLPLSNMLIEATRIAA